MRCGVMRCAQMRADGVYVRCDLMRCRQQRCYDMYAYTVYGIDIKGGERGYKDADADADADDIKSDTVTPSEAELDDSNPFAFLMPKAVTSAAYRPTYTHIHQTLHAHRHHTSACRSVTWNESMLFSAGSDRAIVGMDMNVEKLGTRMIC